MTSEACEQKRPWGLGGLEFMVGKGLLGAKGCDASAYPVESSNITQRMKSCLLFTEWLARARAKCRDAS